jgi:hypothetical protein
MINYDSTKRSGITTILDILTVSQKCIDVLGKHVPIGRRALKMDKRQMKFRG